MASDGRAEKVCGVGVVWCSCANIGGIKTNLETGVSNARNVQIGKERLRSWALRLVAWFCRMLRACGSGLRASLIATCLAGWAKVRSNRSGRSHRLDRHLRCRHFLRSADQTWGPRDPHVKSGIGPRWHENANQKPKFLCIPNQTWCSFQSQVAIVLYPW